MLSSDLSKSFIRALAVLYLFPVGSDALLIALCFQPRLSSRLCRHRRCLNLACLYASSRRQHPSHLPPRSSLGPTPTRPSLLPQPPPACPPCDQIPACVLCIVKQMFKPRANYRRDHDPTHILTHLHDEDLSSLGRTTEDHRMIPLSSEYRAVPPLAVYHYDAC